MANNELSNDEFGVGDDADKGAKDAPSGEGSSSQILASANLSKLKMILDVPLKVSVELGRTKMLVNDLLQMGQGSVVELDKIAGEPMEILINDKLVAMGEVVVVNEKFGVRVTDVVSQFGLQGLEKDDDEKSEDED